MILMTVLAKSQHIISDLNKFLSNITSLAPGLNNNDWIKDMQINQNISSLPLWQNDLVHTDYSPA